MGEPAPGWDGRGRTAVVTGASSGIGAETAVALAAAGARVALVARRADRLEEVRARCDDHTPGSVALVADLSDLDGLDGVVAACTDALGAVPDVWVNNAGVPKRRAVAAMTPADVEGVMALNYFSPVRLTLAVLPGMLERGSGDVVNVSSMGAHMVAFRVGAYAATKAALEMFTEAMWLEFDGTGVRAHLLVPGTTRSEFSTPKDGNDPPFPQDPATATDPADVAAALVASLATAELTTYATERDAATAAAKAADPNGFVARLLPALHGR